MPSERAPKIRKVTVKSVRQATPDEIAGTSRSRGEHKKKYPNGNVGVSNGQYKEMSQTYFFKDMRTARNLFLRGLAFVYFAAFLSLYLQIDGLYGSNGVTPVKAELKLTKRTAFDCLKATRSLLCVIPDNLGLNSAESMELFAISGTILSAFGCLCVNLCVVPLMVILWGLYFSIVKVSGVFLWFQWDSLLLEAGFLGILAAPWFSTKQAFQPKPRDLTSMYMVKWLLFRLMFSSGVVKLMSQCPTWWGLTALDYHFESQCLPTSVAYFAHNLPQWIHRFATVGTFYIEILAPFLFFFPSKLVRKFSFWTQVLFQVSIILTGNYNFFNFLTIVLCFGLLNSSEETGEVYHPPRRFIYFVTSFTVILLSLYFTGTQFGFQISSDYSAINFKTGFTKGEFDKFMSLAVPYSVAIGSFFLGLTIFQSLAISAVDVSGCWNKFKSIFSTLLYSALSIALFGLTLVPYTTLDRGTNAELWSPFRELHGNLSEYQLASSYGLFRRMTGVDGRPELVLEYGDKVEGPWKELNFNYKPGDVTLAPKFIAPHQPRLDWQLWFAALGTYNENPWLLSLTYRLLKGEESVQKLLDVSSNPSKAPKFIRAKLYTYKFTTQSSKSTDWWKRVEKKEYFGPLSVDTPQLVDLMKKSGYLEGDKKSWNSTLGALLATLRTFLSSYPAEWLIWGSISSLILLLATAKLF